MAYSNDTTTDSVISSDDARSVSSPPTWYSWTAWLALGWNALGLAAFFIQMTMDLSELPDAQRVFYETTPIWAKLGFAVAVVGGVVGSLGLILRRSWAVTMLVICLAGIAVQAGHGIFVGNGVAAFRAAGLVMPALTFGIALALTLLARHGRRQGWLS